MWQPGATYATALVGTQFDVTREYADAAFNTATEFINSLEATLGSMVAPTVDYNEPDVQVIVDPYSPTKPDEPSISMELAIDEDKPIEPILDVVTIESVNIPSLGVTAPNIDIPEFPSITWPDDIGEVPPIDEVSVPSVPSCSLPDVPNIDDIVIPDPPSTTLPQFTDDPPSTDIVAPSVTFNFQEPGYSSLRSNIEAAIDDVDELGEDAENALWERGRDKVAITNERVYDEALDFWASRGWILPNGALTGRLTEALAEQARAEGQINYEVTIEAARLSQDASKFKVTSFLELEKTLITYTSDVARRAYDGSVYTQEAGIKVFAAGIEKYKADLIAYQTKATVFESRIRAGMFELEKYKIQIEGSKVTAELQSLRVQVYGAQVGALKTLIDMYVAEMQGAKVKSDISVAKLAAFKEQVNAYTTKINGITSRFNAYGAQVSGETAKIGVFSEQVKAFVAEVEGAKVESSINVAEASIALEANKNLVEEFKANIAMYSERVKALVANINSYVSMYEVEAKMYDSDSKATSLANDAIVKIAEAQIGANINKASLDLKAAEIDLQAYLKTFEVGQATLTAGANVSAQLAASAMNAINATASTGFSGSSGHTSSESEDVSKSSVHTYQEYCDPSCRTTGG